MPEPTKSPARRDWPFEIHFKVFDHRGIKVDDDSRQRIESCTDMGMPS